MWEPRKKNCPGCSLGCWPHSERGAGTGRLRCMKLPFTERLSSAFTVFIPLCFILNHRFHGKRINNNAQIHNDAGEAHSWALGIHILLCWTTCLSKHSGLSLLLFKLKTGSYYCHQETVTFLSFLHKDIESQGKSSNRNSSKQSG